MESRIFEDWMRKILQLGFMYFQKNKYLHGLCFVPRWGDWAVSYSYQIHTFLLWPVHPP